MLKGVKEIRRVFLYKNKERGGYSLGYANKPIRTDVLEETGGLALLGEVVYA